MRLSSCNAFVPWSPWGFGIYLLVSFDPVFLGLYHLFNLAISDVGLGVTSTLKYY